MIRLKQHNINSIRNQGIKAV